MKKERTEVLNLLSGKSDMNQFIRSSEIKSENGKLIQNLIKFVQEKYPLRILHEYSNFLADVCKPSAVAGYLQVRREKPLILLKKYFKELINLRHCSNISNLSLIEMELPALCSSSVTVV